MFTGIVEEIGGTVHFPLPPPSPHPRWFPHSHHSPYAEKQRLTRTKADTASSHL